MYKKIYVEITNNCNLNCDFCIKNERKTEYISIDNFKKILSRLEGYTNYLYFHVLGEPLIHPKINELIDIASDKFKINITTNGYLIKKIIKNKNIRQINISLHSYDEKYKVTLEEYMNNIFDSVEELKQNTYISYRFWSKSKYSDEILEIINKKYKKKLILDKSINNTKIDDNIFISISEKFVWPDLNNKIDNCNGNCYALKDHIGILVDGTIVPCCLDSKGTINLGNIYSQKLEDIINSERYQKMMFGFKNNKRIEKLCQKCNFM